MVEGDYQHLIKVSSYPENTIILKMQRKMQQMSIFLPPDLSEPKVEV